MSTFERELTETEEAVRNLEIQMALDADELQGCLGIETEYDPAEGLLEFCLPAYTPTPVARTPKEPVAPPTSRIPTKPRIIVPPRRPKTTPGTKGAHTISAPAAADTDHRQLSKIIRALPKIPRVTPIATTETPIQPGRPKKVRVAHTPKVTGPPAPAPATIQNPPKKKRKIMAKQEAATTTAATTAATTTAATPTPNTPAAAQTPARTPATTPPRPGWNTVKLAKGVEIEVPVGVGRYRCWHNGVKYCLLLDRSNGKLRKAREIKREATRPPVPDVRQ